jgi:hypothetical protein
VAHFIQPSLEQQLLNLTRRELRRDLDVMKRNPVAAICAFLK